MRHFPNLLIVDNSDANLLLLQAITRKLKINLIKATSGQSALEKTKGIKLALALIDVQMPGMDGYEAAIKLNEERDNDKVPVIFLTAHYTSEQEVIKGYECGAVDFIFKPIHNLILLSKINFFLDLFKQKQEIIRNGAELRIFNDALKISEEKYRSYIDNAPDGIFVVDRDGKFIEVNESACKMTGYSKTELVRVHLMDLFPSESIKDNKVFFESLGKERRTKTELLFRYRNKSKAWWLFESVKLDNERFICFVKDITSRKSAEEDLKSTVDQLHQLTHYIEKIRENERIAISRELHDDLGQSLTAVKIDIGLIRQRVSDPEVVSKISQVSLLVSDTIKSVQRLTSNLRPVIIDDLGIEAAIEWYALDFAKRNRIELSLNLKAETVSSEASLIIFRIMQESLTNIARHSMATHVEISLKKAGKFLRLIISDNGIGITEKQLKSDKSFGLIIMKERAVSIGGNLEIQSENNKGTVIRLVLPLLA